MYQNDLRLFKALGELYYLKGVIKSKLSSLYKS